MTTTPSASDLVLSAGQPDQVLPEVARILRLTMRIAVTMLGSGAQADDVEAAMIAAAEGLHLPGIQAAVTFSTIAVSYDAAIDQPPITLLHIVRDRTVDFDRLAETATLTHRIQTGELDLAGAEAESLRLETRSSPYSAPLRFLAPGASAAGSTLVFGGNLLESVVTLAIALVVQPAVAIVDRSALPPFFRLLVGVTSSTLLVVLLVGLGLPINGGLVLTGSLLRFLPGYALVSGFRDLIGQSVISGTARLAEALLLGAAVASGTALGLVVGASFGVQLAIVVTGQADWGIVVAGAAALLAVFAYGVRLGVPPRAVGQAAVLGAVSWLLYRAVTAPQGPVDSSVATLAAAILIGACGRALASRQAAPAALWVVPAILPLLPGLQIVQAMLAVTDAARIGGLVAAAGTAFIIGTGVATGDIAVTMLSRVRHGIVAPAVGAMADRVDVLIVGPVSRAVGGPPAGESDGPTVERPARRGGRGRER